MCRNPVAYGITFEEVFEDPQLEKKRMDLVKEAAIVLDRAQMIRYDMRSGNIGVTDKGRIASHFYIKHSTVSAFNELLFQNMSLSDAFEALCASSEFEQLKLRQEELPEIEELKLKSSKVSSGLSRRILAEGASESASGKVSVLLQSYLSQISVRSFTLQSDTNYIAQNSSRVARALFEMCLKKNWSSLALYYLTLSKCIDRRLLPTQSPLRQFYNELSYDVIQRLEDLNADVNKLIDMDAREIGQLTHNQKQGATVLYLTERLPHMEIEATVQPITRGVMKVNIRLTSGFKWAEKFHGFSEPFWIWVEDGVNDVIYHSEYFILSKKQASDVHLIEFYVPIREPMPPQYYIRVVSDRWVGCESLVTVSFQHLILPEVYPPHTDLLDMHPIPKSALKNPTFEALYKFSHFNPIQSQMFHVLYHTDNNVLVGAPTGSGKTITSELALLRLLSKRPGAKAVYIAPLKALARERLSDWQNKFSGTLGLTVLELSGDITPDLQLLKKADVIITTPEKWDGITRGWLRREYVQRVELVIVSHWCNTTSIMYR